MFTCTDLSYKEIRKTTYEILDTIFFKICSRNNDRAPVLDIKRYRAKARKRTLEGADLNIDYAGMHFVKQP